MRSSAPLVPAVNEDRDVYLVLDDFGRLGRAWQETDEESTDRTAIIQDLLEGRVQQAYAGDRLQHCGRLVAGCVEGDRRGAGGGLRQW